jgi:hypothetical protein
MSCGCHDEELPILSAIPGPRGATGAAGASGGAGTGGKNAYAFTTAPFIMPAAAVTVTVLVDHTDWCAPGQSLFVESAGYFTVAAIPSAVSLSLTAQNIPSNTVGGTAVPTGRRVVAGGLPHFDSSTLDDYNDRIQALETTPGGNKNYYAASFPSGPGLRVGDILFRTDQGYKMYSWDGSGWVPSNKVLELADFGTGIKPVRTVSVLPPSGAIGDFVILSTDNKIYRGTGSGWTKALSTGELVGQVDASTFLVDGTIIAQKIGAGAVTADAIGANRVVTTAANIGAAVITDAHIANLSAGKVTAGDLQAVNIGYSGRIFHPSGYSITGTTATATATVSSGMVTAVTPTFGGSGYASAPAVMLAGGGGVGAVAVANISDGAVVSFTLTVPGTGYTSAPTVIVAPNYSYHYFRAVEFAAANSSDLTFAAGNVLSGAYAHAAPASAFGPAHPAWTSGTVTACPDSNKRVRIVVQGRLPGYAGGTLLLYARVSGGTPFALASVSAPTTGTAVINTSRLVPVNFEPADYLNIYVAPADAYGVVASPVTCSAEIDLTIYNW